MDRAFLVPVLQWLRAQWSRGPLLRRPTEEEFYSCASTIFSWFPSNSMDKQSWRVPYPTGGIHASDPSVRCKSCHCKGFPPSILQMFSLLIANVCPALPSLPERGSLRLLALFGTLAILFLILSLFRAQKSECRSHIWWIGVTCITSVATFALGFQSLWFHRLAALVTTAVMLRNSWVFAGVLRTLHILALVTWVAAILAARIIFS